MKKLVNFSFHYISIFIFLLMSLHHVSCQNIYNITTGIGIPELLNVGARYQTNQVQIGFSMGKVPDSYSKLSSISGDIYYHFAGTSERSTRRPWYARVGASYFREENNVKIEKFTYLNTRIGREMNISEKIGFQIGIGAFFELSNKSIRKSPAPPSTGLTLNFDFSFKILPSLGMGFFYRL